MDNLFNRVTEGLVHLVMRARWLILAAIVVLTGLAARQAMRVEFDSSVEAWFVDHDPTMVSYQEFLKRFGQDEVVIVGLFAGNVYTPEFLQTLDKFTTAVADAPHVRSATSLANARLVVAGDEGTAMEPLFKTPPTTEAEVAAIRARVENGPPMVRGLVGGNAAATAVIVTLDNDCHGTDKQAKLVAGIKACGAALPQSVTMRVAGTPVVNVGMFQYAERDLRVLIPVALLLVFGTTYFLYRRVRASLIPIYTVGVAVIWVFGTMSLLGWKTNILHSAMVLVLIVCGVANSIHILAAYFREREHGLDPESAACRAVSEIMRAALFANLTTVVGFLSLLSTDLEPIRQYGVLAALGSFFAFVLSVIGVPPLLPYVRPPLHSTHEEGEGSWFVRIVHALSKPSVRSSKIVVACTLLVLLPCVYAIMQLNATANPMNYFKTNDPLRRDIEQIDEMLSGSTTVEFLVTAPEHGLIDRDKLERIDKFEEFLRAQPAVMQVFSLVDALKEYQRAKDPDGTAELPHARRVGTIARGMVRAAPEEMKSLVQDDFTIGRITARIRLADADQLTPKIAEIDAKLASEFSNKQDLAIEGTGFIKLISAMQDYLITSQLKSLPTAAIMISVMMMILLRSWKLGVLAMVPNLVPIAIGMALMSVLGIRLDPGTVMTATVAIGLVVDDTAHFLVHLRDQTAHDLPIEQRISQTMLVAGSPIIATSVILVVGFLALTLGSFNPTVYFGVITAGVIAIAVICDLIITPAILIVVRPKL